MCNSHSIGSRLWPWAAAVIAGKRDSLFPFSHSIEHKAAVVKESSERV